MESIAPNFALTHMHFCSACIVLMRAHTVFNHSMSAKSWCPCPITFSKSLFKHVIKGQLFDLHLHILSLFALLYEGFEGSCRENAPYT